MHFRHRYPERGPQRLGTIHLQFRGKVLDLLKSGRMVTEVASGLEVTEQTTYNWIGPRAHRYWSEAGLSSIESAEPRDRSTSIAELETELALQASTAGLSTSWTH